MNWLEILVWIATGGVTGALGILFMMQAIFGPLLLTFLIAKFKKKWILFEENPNGVIKLKLAEYDSPTSCLKAKNQTFKSTDKAYRLENNINVALVSNECMLTQSPLIASILEALKAKGITREDIIEKTPSLRSITDWLDCYNEPAQEDALREWDVLQATKSKEDITGQFAKMMMMVVPWSLGIMILVIAYMILKQGAPAISGSIPGIGGILPM